MSTRAVTIGYVVAVLLAAGCSVEREAASTATAALSDPQITTDASSYGAGQTVIVSWAGLPGNAHDWVGLAPQGSDPTTVTAWVYTAGAVAGAHPFAAPAAGAYEARAFVDDSYLQLASTSFTVTGGTTASVATDLTSYTLGQPIAVTWTNLPTNPRDWVALAPAGAPVTTVTAWVYTAGASSSGHTFNGPPAGTYVARVFTDDSYALLVEGAPFVVGGAAPPRGTIVVDRPAFGWGQDITITWSDFPTNARDWISLAPEGSSPTVISRWLYTGGRTTGSTTFTDGLPDIGAYIARGFVNDTYDEITETPFQIQEACTGLATAPPLAMVANAADEAAFKDVRTFATLTVAPDTAAAAFRLPCLETVTGTLELRAGTAPGSYHHLVGASFPRLTAVNGMAISDLDKLSAPRLAAISQLQISGTMLPDLTALSQVTALDALTVTAGSRPGQQVGSLRGLEGVTALRGPLEILVPSLADLSGLDNLASVGGDLTLSVASLHGLDQLAAVGGTASIFAGSLGLGHLVQVGGDLALHPPTVRPAVWDITSLTRLATVGGTLSFGTPNHVDFPSLQAAGSLVTNGGLSRLLVSFRAPMLRRVTDQFTFVNHLALPGCEVLAVYNALLDPKPRHVQLGGFSPTCPF